MYVIQEDEGEGASSTLTKDPHLDILLKVLR